MSEEKEIDYLEADEVQVNEAEVNEAENDTSDEDEEIDDAYNAEHYQQILKQNQLVTWASQEYEKSKAKTKALKEAYEEQQILLMELINEATREYPLFDSLKDEPEEVKEEVSEESSINGDQQWRGRRTSVLSISTVIEDIICAIAPKLDDLDKLMNSKKTWDKDAGLTKKQAEEVDAAFDEYLNSGVWKE